MYLLFNLTGEVCMYMLSQYYIGDKNKLQRWRGEFEDISLCKGYFHN